jgi:tetrahydromethanopterin S-methyltransferase subunit G
MTEEMTHLVLEHLRHIRTKVDTIEERVGRVEVRLSAVEGHLGSVLMSESSQNAEIDKIGRRLGWIENRLELSAN